jgi:hypothetical protein
VPLHQQVRLAKRNQAVAAAFSEVGDNGLAHTRLAEVDDVIGDQRHGLVFALAGEKLAVRLAMSASFSGDTLGHPELDTCGWMKSSNRDDGEGDAARTVGAHTATTIGAPIIAAFCTISTDTGSSAARCRAPPGRCYGQARRPIYRVRCAPTASRSAKDRGLAPTKPQRAQRGSEG